MTKFIARNDNNKIFVVDDEEGNATLLKAHNGGFTLYRIQNQGDGTFLLIPQQITGAVTEQVVTGGTFTDG
jgi:hypothetical protein